MAPVQILLEKPARKRRAHTKSRSGCKNCKIRGIKCDEAKPSCERCKSYAASCNYNGVAQDLDMMICGAATMKTVCSSMVRDKAAAARQGSTLHPPLYPFLCPAVYAEDAKYSWQLNSEEIDRLGRFQSRTVLVVGSTKATKYFQRVIVDLACSYPCLMHVIQILTSLHDRYLAGPRTASNAALTISERQHLGKTAKLFNQELSKPIELGRRDGLWATAALLGAVAWATIEASKPEEAWPLTSPDPSDLMWISMSENKLAVWEIAQPARLDSIWHDLALEYKKGFSSYEAPRPGIEGIPDDFVKLYQLTEMSTPENDPYHSAVRNLTKLLPMKCTRDEIGPFIAFIAHFRPEFKNMLRDRDARAMLLIAYWYMKVADSVWSLDWRSKLECQAICIYLEKYHWLDRGLMKMVQLPKKWCGATSPYQGGIWCM